MQKKLVIVGNSVALILDKPLCDLLQLRKGSSVTLSTDGRRLVIEAIAEAGGAGGGGPGEPALSTASLLDAQAVCNTLSYRFNMGQEEFARLIHEPMRMGAYKGWISINGASEATPQEVRSVQRFEVCARELLAGRSWDEAIEAALRAFPIAG